MHGSNTINSIVPATINPLDDSVVGVFEYSQSMGFVIVNDFPRVNLTNIQWQFVDLNNTVVNLLSMTDTRHTFTSDLRVLTINPVLLSDRGTYTLTATNEAGIRNSTINLIVHG